MANASALEASCLRKEMGRLTEEVWHCDYCSTSLEEHINCYEKIARSSGRRSQACFD